jgi:hypothetical protein
MVIRDDHAPRRADVVQTLGIETSGGRIGLQDENDPAACGIDIGVEEWAISVAVPTGDHLANRSKGRWSNRSIADAATVEHFRLGVVHGSADDIGP